MRDWRKAHDYQFPEDFPDYRWAWEFLRRNREYRQEWSDALARMQSREGEFARFPIVEESICEGRIIRSTGMRVTDPEHPRFCIPISAGDRWGLLNGLLNPGTDAPERLSFRGLGGIFYIHEKTVDLSPVGLRFPWAPFDLALPLDSQIEAVRLTLQQEQKKSGFKPRIVRHRRDLLPHYLRLLDADLDGRSQRQIADALEPEFNENLTAGKVWDQLEKAREMTQPQNYLSIFRSSSEISTS